MCFRSAHNLTHQGYWKLIELVLYRFLATVGQLAREKKLMLVGEKGSDRGAGDGHR